MLESTLNILGYEIIFLDIDTKISLRQRYELARRVIEMHIEGKKEARIKNDGYEGQIFRHNYVAIGGFAGWEYDARLDTNGGEAHLGFLALDKVDPSKN